jgi:hypothetical protein
MRNDYSMNLCAATVITAAAAASARPRDVGTQVFVFQGGVRQE